MGIRVQNYVYLKMMIWILENFNLLFYTHQLYYTQFTSLIRADIVRSRAQRSP